VITGYGHRDQSDSGIVITDSGMVIIDYGNVING